MILVTGAAGFIGSNVVRALNARGERDVVAVDDLADGRKFTNLVDCDLADYRDRDEFLEALRAGRALDAARPRAVVHQGACSDTTQWDGRYVMRVNYEFSRLLLEECLARRVPLVYASSAAVYGLGPEFRETPACERPLNLYGYSKLLFDRYVRRRLGRAGSAVVGLRYFNVYGPGEAHKGRMASIVHHLHHQLREHGRARLFGAHEGFAPGEQRRDFVHVDDVVSVVLWCLSRPDLRGIFNVGTGESATFNEVARAVIDWHGRGEIEYVPFPADLVGRYQSHTRADLGALRGAGYAGAFRPVREGVPAYLDALGA